jgi:hypothetical protein
MAEDQVKIKKESESGRGLSTASDGSYYPYGTSLNFDDDIIDELGIGALGIGDVVEVRGFAFVDRKSEHSSKDHSSKNISLQFTSIKIDRETDDRAVQLYGDGS